MFIPDQTVEDVRAASDIVDVVSDQVRLKKRGSNYIGLCPFHNEKTPSFNVNPSMGIFKCFGCGAGGDVFHFVMRTEHVGFPEAVRMLAERAGIAIPEADDRASEAATATEPVYNALRFAARYFYTQLTQAEAGKRGLDYLRKRGFAAATIKRFGLGWAPDAWDSLMLEAEQNHITGDVLEKAGLAIRRKDGNGFYDRYRDRVIFPILSHVGKVLGFGGRVISTGSDQPKYINSPETEVYSKSRVLYGLYHGKQAIRRAEEAILVEGYTDVISMHQAGIENVVAVCGTSLTEGHVKSLSRYAKRIIFLNDADAAGESATVRGISLALTGGLTPYVVELPAGEDPDSFARKHDRDELEEYLRDRRWTFVQFLIVRAQREGRMERPETEAAALNEVLALIASLPDPLAQDAYVHEMSGLLDKPDIILYSALEKIRLEGKRRDHRKDYYTPVPTDEVKESGSEGKETSETGVAGKEDEPDSGREALPEEQMLVRVMLEHGMPLVEFVLGNMALDEFTEGAARDTVWRFLEQYQEGRIESRPFLDGTYGEAIQAFTTGVLTDQYEPSENWSRRNIPVPKLNEDPYEAAASAMMLLKLDRVDEAIQRVKGRLFHVPEDGEAFRKLGSDLMELQVLRKGIEQKAFLQWNRAG